MLNSLARTLRGYPRIAIALLAYGSHNSVAIPRREARPGRVSPSGWLGIPATLSLAFALFALLALAAPFATPSSGLGRALGQIDVIDTAVAGSPAAGDLVAAQDNAAPSAPTASDEQDGSAGLPVASSSPSHGAASPESHEIALGVPQEAEKQEAAAGPAPAAREATRYTVQPGDTVSKIAVRFDVPADAVVAASGLASPDRIHVGQRLIIPGSDGSTLVARAQPSGDVTSSRGAQEAFIAQLAPAAQGSQRVTGVPSSVTLAQAILETYWGTSLLAREANNYFGIKAYARPGTAGVVWIDAWEVENGRNVTRQEPFRKYNQPLESFGDHGRFFIENRRYASAMLAADDPREFARRINAAGYATDPAYASKLISFMDRFNLYQYDVTAG